MLTILSIGRLLVCLLLCVISASALPAQSTDNITNVRTGPLCPWGEPSRGDREFGGNGPDVTCRVNLTISPDKRSLIAKVYFQAKETKSDWSTITDRFEKRIYTAPQGKRIRRILTDTYSEIKFRSPAAGFEFLAPGADFKKVVGPLCDVVKSFYNSMDCDAIDYIPDGDNTVVVLPPGRGRLVNRFKIVGDTGGDDISDDNNCKQDTRIVDISFNRIRVELM